MDKAFFEVTRQFPEINDLLIQSRTLKNQLNKVARRLRTKQMEYDFLQKLVWEFSYDNVLVDSLLTLFNDLGFDAKKLAGDNEEDLQIHLNDELILIEAKGDKSENTSYRGLDQIVRYVTRRKEEQNETEIYGIYIVNHHLKQPDYRKRNTKGFGSDMLKDAGAAKIGLLTTVDLLSGYVSLKRDEISMNDFGNKLKSFGQITF